MCQRVRVPCHAGWRSFGVTWTVRRRASRTRLSSRAGPSRTTVRPDGVGAARSKSFPDERTYRPMTLANQTLTTPATRPPFTPLLMVASRGVRRRRLPALVGSSDALGVPRRYQASLRSGGRGRGATRTEPRGTTDDVDDRTAARLRRSVLRPSSTGERCGCHRSSSPSQIWYHPANSMSPYVDGCIVGTDGAPRADHLYAVDVDTPGSTAIWRI